MLSIERLKFGLFINQQSLSEISNKINIPEDTILLNIKHRDLKTCKQVASVMSVDYRWLMGRKDVPMNKFFAENGAKILNDLYK